MNHLHDIEIIEYIAGNLSPHERAAAAEHLAQCPSCAQKATQQKELWQLTSHWDAPELKTDLSDAIINKVQQTPKTHPLISTNPFIRGIIKIAATIIISIGLGYTLAISTAKPEKPQPLSDDIPNYLSALELRWSSDLTLTILEDEPIDNGEPSS